MTNKIILESLASDLRRVALGLERGSLPMANRFSEEALKRKKEVNIASVETYIVRLLNKMESVLKHSDLERKAEDCLMYSTLLQNYALRKLT